MLRTLVPLLYLCFSTASAAATFGGIQVPGRSVPVLRLFQNYVAMCRTEGRKDLDLDELVSLLKSLNAEEMAKAKYDSLFFAMADVDIEKMMGKWYTVVDSHSVHKDDCGIQYLRLLSQTQFTASFSTVQYATKAGQIVSYEGVGTMMGPDPGELFLSTGHVADVCPYMPVRLGPLSKDGLYEYIILSQPLKYPTVVWARDMYEFKKRHAKEVNSFLEKHGFMSPMPAINTRLHFVNATQCAHENIYYNDLQF